MNLASCQGSSVPRPTCFGGAFGGGAFIAHMRILPWLQVEFKPFASVGVPVRQQSNEIERATCGDAL